MIIVISNLSSKKYLYASNENIQMNFNQYIDHTNLKATADQSAIEKLCQEALTYNFYAVCVNGSNLRLAQQILQQSNVNIASVIGFPLGASSTNSKVFEAMDAINDGANEIDMVINIGQLKSKAYQAVENEITLVKKNIGDGLLKVIVENCYLTEEEKEMICKIVMNSGADFIKTSTGFGSGGATIDDIKLMKGIVKDQLQIKVSGGIRDLETMKQYIELGVDRIGTSSGVQIMNS